MKKNDNPYSFYTLDKTELTSFYNTDKNTINSNNICLYSKQNDNIMQLYNFSNNSTALFRKIENGNFALLYETYIDSEDENSCHIDIYTPQIYYNGLLKSNDFKTISSMDKKDFLFLTNTFGNVANIPGIGHIANKMSSKYVLNHLNLIVSNGEFINTKGNHTIENEFRSTYMRYKMATILIPAQHTIKEILRIITHHIATGKFDKSGFTINYLHLKHFKEIGSKTLQDISKFTIDQNYENLCDSLRNKITNMDNLINMYLNDELEKDKKSL